MDIQHLILNIGHWIAISLPISVGLCLLAFIWGVVKFILASGDEAKLEEGRRTMIWGVVALFVVVSVWGIVSVIGNTLGVNNPTIIQVQPIS